MRGGFDQFEAFLRERAAFSAEEIAAGRRAFRPVYASKGEVLARAGEPVQRVVFVLKGLVRLYFAEYGGGERVHSFRAENQLVCAYSAALGLGISDLSVQAMEPTWFLSAATSEFRRLRAAYPAWDELAVRLTEQKYLQQEKRSRELFLDDASTRYLSFIQDSPALARRLPQGQIAAYIGITPEALSRIRAKLT